MWAWVSLLPRSEVPCKGQSSTCERLPLLSQEGGLWGWPLLSMQCPESLWALSRSRSLREALTSGAPALAGGAVTDRGLRGRRNLTVLGDSA